MNHALWLLLGLCMAAVWDWRERRIPNWLVLAVALAGVGVLLAGPQVQPWGLTPGQASVGAFMALAVLLPFYALGWMGAGDVKLGVALGIWLGWQPWLMAWAVANGLALLHSLWVLGRRSAMVQAWVGASLPVAPPAPVAMPAARRVIPYGSHLCLATVLVLMAGR